MTNLSNLTKMDSIRITKLLELFQYTTLSFFMGFVMGSIINYYLPESNENISTSEDLKNDLPLSKVYGTTIVVKISCIKKYRIEILIRLFKKSNFVIPLIQ